MSDAYLRNREFYQKISGQTDIAAATTTLLAVAAKIRESIFIQKLHVSIIGASAGKTWTIQDDNGVPIVVKVLPTDAIAHYDEDYGADGKQLTAGQALQILISAAGASGFITWEGYRKLTVVGPPA